MKALVEPIRQQVPLYVGAPRSRSELYDSEAIDSSRQPVPMNLNGDLRGG